MPEKTSSPKINLTDTVFIIGLMTWACYLIGRCRVEGYIEAIGIPLGMVRINRESYVELGGFQLMLWAFAAPGFYFMVKGILSAYSQKPGESPSKLATFFSRCSEDARLMIISVLAFGIGSSLLYFGSNFFFQQGQERGNQYLLNPTMVRYTEKSTQTKKQEAILLHYNAERYFLKPKTMSNDVSFIIIEKGDILKLEVLK